jgi:hypothetical protein
MQACLQKPCFNRFSGQTCSTKAAWLADSMLLVAADTARTAGCATHLMGVGQEMA